jgi:hypothetical protein
MNDLFTRRTLLGAGAAGLPVLLSREARALPSAGLREFEPYVTQPGEPVFLLEGSTLEDLWALHRRVSPLVKSSRNPIIVKDREWEGSGPYVYGSVLYDGREKLFKCWYTVYHDHEYRNSLPGSYLACYATSKDGYTWRKPELGVFEWKGSKRNNYIRLARKYVGSITVVEAPKEARLPHRYVACYLDSPGVCLAFSNDGVNWVEHQRNPIEPRHSDTHNCIVWDPHRKVWLVHIRLPVNAGGNNRRIATMESADLETWSRAQSVLLPDEEDFPEFYSMPVFRRGNLFFGLLQIYERPIGRIEVELVFSPDGYRWHRVPPRELFLERGQAGQWDRGMVLTASGTVIAHDEMRFYYGGTSIDHNQRTPPDVPIFAIGMASVPLDRMFGLHTSSKEPGFAVTRPMRLHGTAIEVNATVRGELRAALLSPDGKKLPGFDYKDCSPVKGDDLRLPLAWKGQKLPNSELVRLKFQIAEGALYAFYVR